MIIPKLSTATTPDESAINKLGVAGEVYVHFTDNALVNAHDECKSILLHENVVVGPFTTGQSQLAANWLNLGARRVVMSPAGSDLEAFLDDVASLPKDRVVILVSQAVESFEDMQLFCGGFFVQVDDATVDLAKLGETLSAQRGGATFSLDLVLDTVDNAFHVEELVGKLHRLSKDHPVGVVTPCALPDEQNAQVFEIKEDDQMKEVSLGRAVCQCLRTDRPDGLYATVVTDEFGVAIGMVYSNDQSVCSSVGRKRGVYWSRSRGNLWCKGDTTGAWQALLSIRMDCDSDALKFSVIQHGTPPAFCHKNTLTCWGHENGLPHLFRTLLARKENPPPGSYTQRLFQDRELLRNKLLEEAQELIEAVEEDDKVHVAEETADLVYFALVACAAGGANLREVAEQLDNRSLKVKRRPGNAKEYRIKAAAELMQKKE